MTEAAANKSLVNQAALKWLDAPDPEQSYLAQLAMWGLEKGGAQVPRPMSPSQPERYEVESQIEALLAATPSQASRWLLSNPNLEREEQATNLAQQLQDATSPEEAAQIVVQTAYDRMVAESATSPV